MILTDEDVKALKLEVYGPHKCAVEVDALRTLLVKMTEAAVLERVVDDLSALVRRLALALRKVAPDNDLPEKALDYLRRKNLQGSPLRDSPPSDQHDQLYAAPVPATTPKE